MSVMAQWQDLFFVQETADINGRIDFENYAVGIGGTNAGPVTVLSVNPKVGSSFSLGSRKYSNPKSLNTASFNSSETMEGSFNPSNVNYSCPMTLQALRFFGRSLFQNYTFSDLGVFSYEGSSYRKGQFQLEPYTSPEIDYYLGTLRGLNRDSIIQQDRKSWEMWGSIVNNIKISGSSGSIIDITSNVFSTRANRSNVLGVISNSPRLRYFTSLGQVPNSAAIYRESSLNSWLQLDASVLIVSTEDDFTDPSSLSSGSVEMAQSTGALNFSDTDISSYEGQFVCITYTSTARAQYYQNLPVDFGVSIPPLKFQDAIFEFDGDNLKIVNFDLSFSNNPVPKSYDEESPHKLLLGRLAGTFDVSISWGDSNFGDSLALRDYLLNETHDAYLYWGNKTVSDFNDLSIRMRLLTKNVSIIQDKGELISKVLFEIVEDGANAQTDINGIFVSYEQGLTGIYLYHGIITA